MKIKKDSKKVKLYNLKNLRQKEEEKMNKCKILGLLLAACIGLMGFNELTFAAQKSFIPPAWYQKLPALERFQVVLDNAAVLDKETGLVWEKSPNTTTRTWYDAVYYAYNKNVGGRGGWRLPTVEELRSLIDPTQSNPTLPSGHPFINVQSLKYWSSNTDSFGTNYARVVNFSYGVVGATIRAATSATYGAYEADMAMMLGDLVI